MNITKSVRELHPVLKSVLGCTACNSFWIGIAFYSVGFNIICPTQLSETLLVQNEILTNIITTVLQGFLSSGLSWIIFSLVQLTGVYDKY